MFPVCSRVGELPLAGRKHDRSNFPPEYFVTVGTLCIQIVELWPVLSVINHANNTPWPYVTAVRLVWFGLASFGHVLSCFYLSPGTHIHT